MSGWEQSLHEIPDPDEKVIWSARPQETRTTRWQAGDFAAGWVLALGLSAAALAKGLSLLPPGNTACEVVARSCRSEVVVGTVFIIGATLVLYVALRMSMSALRNRRALLLRTDQSETTVRSIPVHPDFWLSYCPGRGGEIGLSRMVHGESDDGSAAYDEEMVIFRKLDDPEAAYRLLRSIQNQK